MRRGLTGRCASRRKGAAEKGRLQGQRKSARRRSRRENSLQIARRNGLEPTGETVDRPPLTRGAGRERAFEDHRVDGGHHDPDRQTVEESGTYVRLVVAFTARQRTLF